MTKAVIIYCSTYKGNTKGIASVMAKRIDAELLDIKDARGANLEEYNLIGFGSGVYREDISKQLYEFVSGLSLKGKDVFIFSTSGAGMKYYNNKLIKILRNMGGTVKGSFACRGYFIAKEFTDNKIFSFVEKLSQGHPNSKDFQKAERFAEAIIK